MLHGLRAHARAFAPASIAFVVAAAAAIVLGLAPAARAVVLIGNLPGNDATSTFMNAPYTLDYVDLRLNYFNTSSVPVVQIYSNVGGNPGTALTTLNAPPIVVGPGTVRFTPSGTFTLDPSTTYWALVWNNATVANSFQWLASSPAVTPTGIATSAGYRFSNGPPPPIGNSTTLNSYEIGATLVPEPTTGFAIAAAVGGACASRPRRRQA
jgi:hypothetical protein